jgi:hypothetical protein
LLPLQHTLAATRCPGTATFRNDPASAFYIRPTRAAWCGPFWPGVSPVRFYAHQRSKASSLDVADVRRGSSLFAVILARRA